MRKRLLLLAGLAGVIGLVWRRRRRPAAALPAPDPADELRRKLDQTRERATPEPDSPGPSDDLEARRRSVHERGRQAVEEMHPSSPD